MGGSGSALVSGLRGPSENGCTLGCILAAECARVPAVYLTHAILAILAIIARLEINNLRVCSGPAGSNPTRASKFSPLFCFN